MNKCRRSRGHGDRDRSPIKRNGDDAGARALDGLTSSTGERAIGRGLAIALLDFFRAAVQADSPAQPAGMSHPFVMLWGWTLTP